MAGLAWNQTSVRSRITDTIKGITAGHRIRGGRTGKTGGDRYPRTGYRRPALQRIGRRAAAPRNRQRVAGLYRFESGAPFTPGFRDGVDANGDGSATNDPAFVDASLDGMSEVVNEWGCLQDQTGGFAARNSCRGPDTHALDARLTLGVFANDAVRADLVVDALNLIAGDHGIVDDALVLVDPSAPLNTAANGAVTVPLLANPDFGTLLMRFSPQRVFRIGLRLRY
jgi:hypothetical protein